jgi:alpha-L-fucosidase
MQDGTVIPEEREPLLQVGAWLSKAGDAIYGTRPWFIQPADQTPGLTNVRFTTTASAFYILALERPTNGSLKTAAPVPIIPGDKVRLLGGSGTNLNWSVDESSGVLSVDVSDDELDMVNLPAWAFEVVYA